MADKRVTVESLRLYVPLFQQGEAAENRLKAAANSSADNAADSSALDLKERARLVSQVALKKLAYDELAELTYPLMRREIINTIRSSHLKREEEEIFSVIYYAGLGGMERGLRKFDVAKIEESATNYIFQWIMVYAKKELLRLEAPMGVPPTRFQKHKKIAAVRKKLSELLERPASNEEVLEYFHTGRAEFKSYNGPKIKGIGVSEANKKITMDLVEEQEQIEKNLTFAQMFDSSEDYRTERLLSSSDSTSFAETLMGSFLTGREFGALATAVIKSDLDQDTTVEEDAMLKKLSPTRYQSIMRVWRDYLGDPRGEFREFLEAQKDSESVDSQVDVLLKSFEAPPKTKRSALPARYSVLFEN